LHPSINSGFAMYLAATAALISNFLGSLSAAPESADANQPLKSDRRVVRNIPRPCAEATGFTIHASPYIHSHIHVENDEQPSAMSHVIAVQVTLHFGQVPWKHEGCGKIRKKAVAMILLESSNVPSQRIFSSTFKGTRELVDFLVRAQSL
jgi:hypothetical protein